MKMMPLSLSSIHLLEGSMNGTHHWFVSPEGMHWLCFVLGSIVGKVMVKQKT